MSICDLLTYSVFLDAIKMECVCVRGWRN